MLFVSDLDVSVLSCSRWREEITLILLSVVEVTPRKVPERSYTEGDELKLFQCQETHLLLNQAVRLLFWAVKR